jgi:hypothetical protein
VLLYTLLGGTQHPLVSEYKVHYKEYTSRKAELERVHPRNPRHFYIVLALLVRWVQLELTYWIRHQATSNTPIVAPVLSVLFDNIARGKDWAPLFPERYLGNDTPTGAVAPTQILVTGSDQSSVMSGLTGTNPSGPGSPGTQSTENTPVEEKVQYNLDYQERFQSYKELGHATRQVKAYCARQKIKMPYNATIKKPMCISFHVKGICNNRCGSNLDHAKHTKALDNDLEKWCKLNYRVADPVEAAPATPDK